MSKLDLTVKLLGVDGGAGRALKTSADLLREQDRLEKQLIADERKRLEANGTTTERARFNLRLINEELRKQSEAHEKNKEKLRESLNLWKEGLSAASGRLGGGFGLATGIATGGMTAAIEHGIRLFESGIEFVKKAGEFAVDQVKELYAAGREDSKLAGRTMRQFGQVRGGRFMELAEGVGVRSGIESSNALKGLLAIREAMPDVSRGMRVTGELAKQLGMGSRRTLTGDDATRLEDAMLKRRLDVFARLETLRPGMDAKELGRIVGNVGNAQGAKQFTQAFGLSKEAAKILGGGKLTAADMNWLGMSPEEQRRLGGGRMRQFDLIERVLSKSGMGEDAAEAERQKLDFSIKAIKAELGNVFSDLGTAVYEGINGPLKKGVPLSKQLHDWLASDDMKAKIKEIGNDIGLAARGIGVMLTAAPALVRAFASMAEYVRPIGSVLGVLTGGIGTTALKNPLAATGAILPAAAGNSGAAGGTTGVAVAGAWAAGKAMSERGQAPPALPPVNVTANVSGLGPGQSVADFVHSIMPHLERQLVDKIVRETANGAAPAAG